MKYIYVEMDDFTEEITSVFEYITKYPSHIGVYKRLSDLKYTAIIVDIQRYIKKYNMNKPDSVHFVIHNYIIKQGRGYKINIIKERVSR